ncbi:MAG: hypothetical protein ACREV3_02420, partial [Gammaproteobacteria bacterium]
GTSDRKEALALEAKWKLEAYRLHRWGEQPSREFDELLLNYLKATQSQKRSAERDRTIARHLREQFGGRTLQDLAAADVRSFIERRQSIGIKATTINRELVGGDQLRAPRVGMGDPQPGGGPQAEGARRTGTLDHACRGPAIKSRRRRMSRGRHIWRTSSA